jgi:histidine triad (HIT) family protein
MTSGCIFCQIARGERAAKVYHEDDRCLAFQDLNPQAPTHILVVPRRHLVSLNGTPPEDEALLGHLLRVAAQMAKEQGIDGTGFRVVINTNAAAGQSVYHLHLHLIGGRSMRWPPG